MYITYTICPFGINDYVEVYLDISLKDLEASSNYIKWVDVSK